MVVDGARILGRLFHRFLLAVGVCVCVSWSSCLFLVFAGESESQLAWTWNVEIRNAFGEIEDSDVLDELQRDRLKYA